MSECAVAKARLARTVNQQANSSLPARIAHGVKTSLLLSVKTFGRAFGGNTVMALWRHGIHQPASAAFDVARSYASSALTGGKIKPHEFRSVANAATLDGLKVFRGGTKRGARPMLREATAATKGMGWTAKHVAAWIDEVAVQLDASALQSGGNVLEYHPVAYKSAFMRAAQDAGRMIPELPDRAFYHGALDLSIYAQAKLYAIREGLTGQAMKERAAWWQTHPTEEMVWQALTDAQYATFKDRSAIGHGAARFKAGVAQAMEEAQTKAKDMDLSARERASWDRQAKGYAAMHVILEAYVMPFTNVAGSVTSKMVAFSPAGFASPRIWNQPINVAADVVRSYVKAAGSKEKASSFRAPKLDPKGPDAMAIRAEQAHGIMASSIGVGLWWLGWQLYKDKLLTAAGPRDPSDRNVAEARGQQNWSIALPGGYSMNVNWAAPGMSALYAGALMAKAAEESPNKTPWDRQVEGVQNVGDMVIQQTYLDNIARMTEAGGRRGNMLTSLAEAAVPVPPLIRQLSQATDATVRDPKNPLQAILAQVPGASHLVPAKQTVFGESVKRSPVERASSVLLPGGIRKSTDTPGLKELARLGLGLSRPATAVTIDKKASPIPPALYQLLLTTRGKVWRQRLENAVGAPGYRALDDTRRAAILKAILDDANDALRKQLVTEPLRGQ